MPTHKLILSKLKVRPDERANGVGRRSNNLEHRNKIVPTVWGYEDPPPSFITKQVVTTGAIPLDRGTRQSSLFSTFFFPLELP